MSRTEQITLSVIIATLACLVLVFASLTRPTFVAAGVGRGSSYQGTSTAYFSTSEMQITATTSSETGLLGSVTITGANSGTMNIYDATTSNVNSRTGNVSSSSILLASFPASTAAGTYIFDRQFYTGLLIELTGTAPTSTVTYRTGS